MTELWDRQPEETHQSFQGFSTYRDLPPTTRSIPAAAAIHYEVPVATEVQIRQLKEWSSRFMWVNRAAAWDEFVDKKAQAENLEDLLEVRRRHATIARGFLDKAMIRLEDIDPDILAPSDLARWLDVATRIEREAVGTVEAPLEDQDTEQERKIAAKEKLTEIAERLASVEERVDNG